MTITQHLVFDTCFGVCQRYHTSFSVCSTETTQSACQSKRRLLDTPCLLALLGADIDHAILLVICTKPTAYLTQDIEAGCFQARDLLTALDDVHHAWLPVRGAEATKLLPRPLELRVVEAKLMLATLALDINHARLDVMRTKTSTHFTSDVVPRLSRATKFFTTAADDINHAWLLVFDAEPTSGLAVNVEAWLSLALLTLRTENVHHSQLHVFLAEPPSTFTHCIVVRLFAASLALAPLFADVHHPWELVGSTEQTLQLILKVERGCPCAAKLFAKPVTCFRPPLH